MSDLPTLYVPQGEIDTLEGDGCLIAYSTVALAGAENARGEPVVLFVPASRLDAANLEIARLKGDAAGLRVILGEAQKAIRSSGAAELNEENGKWEHVHKPLLNVIKAALTPKDP
jgi:hypothetical protein